MKTKIVYLILLTFLLNLKTHAQGYEEIFGQKEKKKDYFDMGTYLDFGLLKTVPTNNILFPGLKSQNSNVERQTLSSEWGNPNFGGYVDLSYNFGVDRPVFIGLSFKWQNIYKNMSSNEAVFEDEDGFPIAHIDYTYTNKSLLSNYSVYSEITLFKRESFLFFVRNELGLSAYNSNNFVKWNDINNAVKKTRVTLNKFSEYVFSTDLGLGVRWQFSDIFSLKGLVGYHLQMPNNFYRKSYVDQFSLSIVPENGFPNDDIWNLNEPIMPPSRMRIQNEYIYLQLGLSINLRDWRMHEKPVLYLYPEDTTEVNVKVHFTNHKLAFSYPKYDDKGWNVLAYPNGDLIDNKTGRRYYTLFWETEGKPIAKNLNSGFVVSGNETQRFLEQKLEALGLNYREINEFIIYWLPQMESNPYNAIYFAFEEYEATSQLEIQPAPDTVIRLMMLWQPLEKPMQLMPQTLPKKPERKGFVVVEWGGSEGVYFDVN